MATAEETVKAAQSGDIESLRKYLSEDPSLAASRDAMGVSALMHAVYRRQTAAVDLLRQSGLTLDVFEAAATGDLRALTSLITRDPLLLQAHSPDGFTALHLAAYFSQPSAACFLLDRGANHAAVARNATQVMPLHSAAAGGNLATVRDLLARGAPVNARQQLGWTALHSATQNGNSEMVDALLQHGADAAARNDEGVTPLDLARKQGRADLAQRLARAAAETQRPTAPADALGHDAN